MATIPFRHLQSKPATQPRQFASPKFAPLAFFSKAGDTASILDTDGLFVTIELEGASRPANQIAAAIAVSTGCEIDEAGDLKTLPAQEIAARWKAIARPVNANRVGSDHMSKVSSARR